MYDLSIFCLDARMSESLDFYKASKALTQDGHSNVKFTLGSCSLASQKDGITTFSG